MAEEFQAGICGGTWWNIPTRSSLLSPCSGGIGITDHIGSFGWPSSTTSTDHHHQMVDMKAATAATTTTTRSCEESNNSVSGGGGGGGDDDSPNMVFQSVQKPQVQTADSDSTGGSSSILMDSTLQMMSFGLSSSTSSSTDWNPALVLREDMNSQIQKDWSPSNMEAAASYGYPSTLLQSFFEPEPLHHQPHQQQQQQQSLFSNRSINNNNNNYMSGGVNYGTNVSNDIQLSPANSWPKNIINPLLKPSLPKHQPPTSTTGLHFSNNAPFWNANASAAATPLNDIRTGFFPSSQPQFLTVPVAAIDEKPSCPSLTAKSNNEEVRDSAGTVGKKGSSEPAFKRPRIETPSPLPTFKVRKEKLGDRITALQQLVSPFGKTDTASVLHEAIEYIKFLHDQVSVLSTPYMKEGTPIQQQQGCDKLKDPEQPKQDLRSRGLCLVPISSTFPVANETTAALWTPTYGGTFR
ncbi:hypothetical protein ACOSQ4_012366 [Xanthoceras sorbifolium]